MTTKWSIKVVTILIRQATCVGRPVLSVQYPFLQERVGGMDVNSRGIEEKSHSILAGIMLAAKSVQH